MNTHYYILPDGSRAENMKEACKSLGVGSRFFKTLIKRGLVKKILTSEASSPRNVQEYETEDNKQA